MNNIEKQIDAVLNKKITNESLIRMYYEIGNTIKNYTSKELKELELKLKYKYGVVIAFTDRNFIHMIHFSNYSNKLLPEFEKITWKNILVIMKEKDDSLIDICLEYNPTKQELINYIKKESSLKKNMELEMDDTLDELIRLQRKVGN